MRQPGLIEMGSLFLRIGNTTFGGGDPTMAALHQEMVERRRWITANDYGLCYSLARVTPGTNVLAFCAAAAWLVRGWAGAAVAVAGACVPSAVLAVCLVNAYEAWSGSAAVRAAVGGMVAGVVGIMGASAVVLYRSQAQDSGWARGLVFAAGAGLLVGAAGWGPVTVLGLAAAAGGLWRERE